MSEQQLPPKKSAPRPSKAEQSKAKHFELELLDAAITAYKGEDYLKAAMMSWSFIEEFFLPTYIEFTAKRQKLGFKRRVIENASAMHLIRYYYLVTYDEELFVLLDEARKRRNSFIHGVYKSGSIEEITELARASAKYNLYTLGPPVLKRLGGEVVVPSLQLYAQGWNDSRAKMHEYIEKRKQELEDELAALERD